MAENTELMRASQRGRATHGPNPENRMQTLVLRD